MCAPFCVFLIWDLGLLFRIAEVFALSHCGFDFCQIACIVVFNFLNSNLSALILKDWFTLLFSAYACFIGGYGVQDSLQLNYFPSYSL